MPPPQQQFGLVETRPPLAAVLRPRFNIPGLHPSAAAAAAAAAASAAAAEAEAPPAQASPSKQGSPVLGGIANTRSWSQFYGSGFSIRVPPSFDDILEPEVRNLTHCLPASVSSSSHD